MKKTVLNVFCLVLTLFLTVPALSGPVSAVSASYPDLPESHWAYAPMSRAAAQGLLSGYPGGAMRPEEPLSWGQYLTLLGRAFYPETLAVQGVGLSEADHWATAAYRAAQTVGVLQTADFLPFHDLDSPLSRQDAAVLTHRALLTCRDLPLADISNVLGALSDLNSLPEPYRGPVLQCCARNILGGNETGAFAGGSVLTRGAGAAMLMRALDAVPAPQKPQPTPAPNVGSAAGTLMAPGGLRDLGQNAAKLIRLYGTAEQTRYPSREEAEAHMMSVTVPVWHLAPETGEKAPSTCTFLVNSALADDMEAIFTEIFNDPEQFPIYAVEAYAWRGDAATGEHNCGTAIDLNPNENYQLYADGRVGAGDHWTPGEDPYSIPEDGSVVRIFNAYGYTWGGNAWPTNRDYMHFSYLGV